MARWIFFLYLTVMVTTAFAARSTFSSDDFAAKLCPVILANQPVWTASIEAAAQRLENFHEDNVQPGAIIDFSPIGKFIGKYRDGFALAFIDDRLPVDPLVPAPFVELIGPFYTKVEYGNDYSYLRFKREHAARLASPLVEYLLHQPQSSVSHSELFKRAIEIYHDPLTAYGLIAFIFYEEAKNTIIRPAEQILASKMIPILDSENADQVGANYHFWVYMSLGLQDRGALGNMASLFLERIRQNDPNERASDLLGLKTGRALRNCNAYRN